MKINLNLKLKSELELKETILTPKKRDDREIGILIIEDEKIWRQLYTLNLLKKTKNKRRKYTFYEALNGREGIKLIAQHYSQIKVILLDLVMDKMEGMEVLKLLIDQWGFLNLGIFILTAYGTEETMVASQLRGVRGFYDKNNL
ncbi:MAG: response regulator, partial [Microcystaceae cyanobacterium]